MKYIALIFWMILTVPLIVPVVILTAFGERGWFDIPKQILSTDGDTFATEGMRLRDYFAAKAMQAKYESHLNSPDSSITYKEISQRAYQLADEMLKQRER